MNIKVLKPDISEIKAFLQMNRNRFKMDEDFLSDIVQRIKTGGDRAVLELVRENKGLELTLETMKVTDQELQDSFDQVDDEFLAAMYKAIDNITGFHERQLRNSWMEPDSFGNILGQIYRPLRRVGICVSGRQKDSPSTVLMHAVPAQVAGVKEIALAVGTDEQGKVNPYVLAAASEIGLREIYKIGGTAGIFAFGWGTETIPKADLITGSGSPEIIAAKHILDGQVQVENIIPDSTDLLILADVDANIPYLTADFLAQIEKEQCISCIVVAENPDIIGKMEKELEQQLHFLDDRKQIEKKIQGAGAVIAVENMDEACAVINQIAPEHLEMMIREPFLYLNRIQNAGAVFMGTHTPAAMGDYLSGCNHILPTEGRACFSSSITVDTFMKSSHFIYYSQDGFRADLGDAVRFAEVEGSPAQLKSLKIRKWQ